MAEIVSFSQKKIERDPHLSGAAVCMLCCHRWVAVVPVGTVWLECPNCLSVKGHLIFECERIDEPCWTCSCGNDLFKITPKAICCVNCGMSQVLPQ